MNKLSKEKRNQLILVGMITVAGLIGLWFGLISFQLDYLKGIAARTADAQKTRIKQDQEIKDANKVQAELEVASKRVAELEEDMGPPDLSSWMYDTIRRFKQRYKVEIPQVSQPEVKDVSMLPDFPYKQATITVGGTAYYHEFGKFLADFENQFPYYRVLNLDLEPVSGLVGGEKEKLSFRMDIVTLIKPGTS